MSLNADDLQAIRAIVQETVYEVIEPLENGTKEIYSMLAKYGITSNE